MFMTEKITIKYFTSPFGELIVGSYENRLCLLDWRYRKMRERIDARIQEGLGVGYALGESDIIERTIREIGEYATGDRRCFDIPLYLVGTDFEKQVWEALQNIEFGSTLSYLELSRKIGNEKALRAVGAANGANAISIIVPCHRIVGSRGELVGYAGGLSAKKKLLKQEHILDLQLDLFTE